jgi:hypothetical protein
MKQDELDGDSTSQQVIERQTNDNFEYGKEYAGLIKTPYRNLVLDKRVFGTKKRPERHILFLPKTLANDWMWV